MTASKLGDFKAKVLILSQELEDLLSEKIVEMISSRSEIGELRQKCDTFQVTFNQ